MFRNIVLMYTTELTVIILLWILYVLGIADVPILRVVFIVAYDILHIHNVNGGLWDS